MSESQPSNLEPEVLICIEGAVRRITLNRPVALHALTTNMRVLTTGARVLQRHDGIEGVRTLMVDKDNAPRRRPPTLERVSEAMLDEIFAPLPSAEAGPPLFGEAS